MKSLLKKIILIVTILCFKTEPLHFIAENVTAYSFRVTAKLPTTRMNDEGDLIILYKLNEDRSHYCLGRDADSSHLFCTIYDMRPNTKLTLRVRLCPRSQRTCTDYSKGQTVWIRPAGKLSFFYNNVTFSPLKRSL